MFTLAKLISLIRNSANVAKLTDFEVSSRVDDKNLKKLTGATFSIYILTCNNYQNFQRWFSIRILAILASFLNTSHASPKNGKSQILRKNRENWSKIQTGEWGPELRCPKRMCRLAFCPSDKVSLAAPFRNSGRDLEQ